MFWGFGVFGFFLFFYFFVFFLVLGGFWVLFVFFFFGGLFFFWGGGGLRCSCFCFFEAVLMVFFDVLGLRTPSGEFPFSVGSL